MTTTTTTPATKVEMLGMLRRARSSHLRWRAFAQSLIAGAPIKPEQAPVSHTGCDFGVWYYGEGSEQFGHMEIFQDIGGSHEMLHAVYGKLFALVQRGQAEEARAELNILSDISCLLLDGLALLEAEVKAL